MTNNSKWLQEPKPVFFDEVEAQNGVADAVNQHFQNERDFLIDEDALSYTYVKPDSATLRSIFRKWRVAFVAFCVVNVLIISQIAFSSKMMAGRNQLIVAPHDKALPRIVFFYLIYPFFCGSWMLLTLFSLYRLPFKPGALPVPVYAEYWLSPSHIYTTLARMGRDGLLMATLYQLTLGLYVQLLIFQSTGAIPVSWASAFIFLLVLVLVWSYGKLSQRSFFSNKENAYSHAVGAEVTVPLEASVLAW